MRKTFISILLLVYVFFNSIGAALTDVQNSKPLKGPYLGQDPPGTKPQVFAPAFISTPDRLCQNP